MTATVVLDTNDNVDDINGKANASFDGGTVTGTASFDANFGTGAFGLTSLTLQAFHNSLVFQGALDRAPDGTLQGYGTGTFTTPASVFGSPSISGTLLVYISPSSDESLSYFEAYANFSFFGTTSTWGVRIQF